MNFIKIGSRIGIPEPSGCVDVLLLNHMTAIRCFSIEVSGQWTISSMGNGRRVWSGSVEGCGKACVKNRSEVVGKCGS
jgi:hypothetical protein